MLRAKVTVYPRREVLDPQGKAIRDALARIGFGEVEDVRAGKSFEIQLGVSDPTRAEELLRQMCQRLLANPVVEDYAFELLQEAGAAPATSRAGASGPQRASSRPGRRAKRSTAKS